MAVKTLPLDMDLPIHAGTTCRREYRWKPDGTTPLDFTGWSGELLIGPFGEDAIITLTTLDGLHLTTLGQIIFELDTVQTESLRHVPTLSYQLDLTDPSGFRMRFIQGRVTVYRYVEPAA